VASLLSGTGTDLSQQRISPLAGIDKSGSSAPMPSAGLISITELRDTALLQLFAKKGQEKALATELQIGLDPGAASYADEFTALPLAPGQWMLSAKAGGDGEFYQQMATRIAEYAHLSEQSHGRVIFRVAGSNARMLLQKGCRLDLHPSVTSAGFCAQTPIAQVGVLLHQLDEIPTYDLYVYSGFARSFWQWLSESAAQYGYTAS